jgi:hypothetical protein
MTEQTNNLGQTTLKTGITAGATTLTVASAANLPTTGTFRIIVTSLDTSGNPVNPELMICTAITGTTLTVTRAQESTTAQAHNAGEVVANVFTSTDYQALLTAIAAAGNVTTALPSTATALPYFSTTTGNLASSLIDYSLDGSGNPQLTSTTGTLGFNTSELSNIGGWQTTGGAYVTGTDPNSAQMGVPGGIFVDTLTGFANPIQYLHYGANYADLTLGDPTSQYDNVNLTISQGTSSANGFYFTNGDIYNQNNHFANQMSGYYDHNTFLAYGDNNGQFGLSVGATVFGDIFDDYNGYFMGCFQYPGSYPTGCYANGNLNVNGNIGIVSGGFYADISGVHTSTSFGFTDGFEYSIYDDTGSHGYGVGGAAFGDVNSNNNGYYIAVIQYGTGGYSAGIYLNGVVTINGGLNGPGYYIGGTGAISGASVTVTGGTSSQFLKADGSLDSTAYAPAATSPLIVGNARATGKTAAFALATYTVGASDTTFQVSANVNITAVTVASFQVTCTYHDETNTSRTLVLNFSQINGTFVQTLTAALGVGAYEGVPLQIRAKAGTTIIIASTAGGTYTSVTYSLEERIIQL